MVAADRLLEKDALQEISAFDAVIHLGLLFRKNQCGLKFTGDDHGQGADILLQNPNLVHILTVFTVLYG